MLDVIFNADDFGISQGVNDAIFKAHTEGILNSTSLMINQDFAADAVQKAKQMPDLKIGLHINLTNQKPASNPDEIPLLVDKDGNFKNGFVNLFILSFFHPKALRQEAYIEIKSQIEKYLKTGLKLDHLDSHRHIHLIPPIFKAVKQLAKEYNVPRIRVMNENIFNTVRQNKSKSYLLDGGIIKYFLLRFLSAWNTKEKDVYFYTILYTCKISKEQFNHIKIPKGYKAVEIMIHPSVVDVDKAHTETIWDQNVLSDWRTVELNTLLDKNVLNGIEQ